MLMKVMIRIACVVSVCAPLWLLAAENDKGNAVAEAPKDEGAAAFSEHCAACHMVNGHGIAAMKAPSIAGLERWYVAYQLRRFRDGTRGAHKSDAPGKLMHDVTARLDDRTIAFLSRYVSELAPNEKRTTLKQGDPKRGGALFKDRCMPCHRYNASGERVFHSAPLNRQQDWYLLAQLTKFKGSHRGYKGDDRLGKKMREVTRLLDLEKDAPDIVAWLSRLPVEEKKEGQPD
jgi:cytochrome c553